MQSNISKCEIMNIAGDDADKSCDNCGAGDVALVAHGVHHHYLCLACELMLHPLKDIIQ